MWISLIIALLTYLLAPRGTDAEKRKALLMAAGAGAATYAVTEYTDWGQENLKPYDDQIDDFLFGDSDEDLTDEEKEEKIKFAVDNKVGLWDKIQQLGPAGWAALGLGAAAVTGNTKWIPWAVGGVAAVLLLR